MSARKSKDFKDTKGDKMKRSPKSRSSKRGLDRKTDLSDKVDKSGRRHNDVSWYTPDVQILNDAARLPYSIPVGMPYGRSYINQGTTGLDRAEPGVLTQFIMPTYGKSDDAHSPMNVAGQGIYTFVRHMNSGSRNYDPTDLMIYMMSMDSLFSLVAWGTRTFATLCTYHQGNRYLPKMLLEAQNLDFDDFANNMAQFRAGLNLRIAKLGDLVVPNVMPIFQRHAWIFSNYYIEGENIKDQVYQYAPMGFYKFQLDSDGAGMLKAIDIKPASGRITVSQFFTIMDNLIDAIFMEEDFGIMSGDILKAYASNVLRLQYIPDMINVAFQYDESVLLQFKNAKTHSVNEFTSSGVNYFASDFFDLHQSANKDYLLVTHPLAGIHGFRNTVDRGNTAWVPVNPSSAQYLYVSAFTAWQEWSEPTLLTSPHAEVTAEENMINTRGTMAFVVDAHATLNYTAVDYTLGSEWYGPFVITWATRNRATLNITVHHIEMERVVTSILDMAQGYSNMNHKASIMEHYSALISRFKYHPEIKFLVITFADATDVTLGWETNLGDMSQFEVDNYTVQDFEIINAMHNAALLGEFNVPRIAVSAS